jgi:hypothetical protein
MQLNLGSFSCVASQERICRMCPSLNLLNAELNPICHLLVLLGDIKLMGPCIVKYIPIYIQQDANLNILFIPGNCSTCFGWYFHPSSGAYTTVSTASGICHTVTAICRYQLELVWVCCGWPTPTTALSNRFQLFHDSGR